VEPRQRVMKKSSSSAKFKGEGTLLKKAHLMRATGKSQGAVSPKKKRRTYASSFLRASQRNSLR